MQKDPGLNIFCSKKEESSEKPSVKFMGKLPRFPESLFIPSLGVYILWLTHLCSKLMHPRTTVNLTSGKGLEEPQLRNRICKEQRGRATLHKTCRDSEPKVFVVVHDLVLVYHSLQLNRASIFLVSEQAFATCLTASLSSQYSDNSLCFSDMGIEMNRS